MVAACCRCVLLFVVVVVDWCCLVLCVASGVLLFADGRCVLRVVGVC